MQVGRRKDLTWRPPPGGKGSRDLLIDLHDGTWSCANKTERTSIRCPSGVSWLRNPQPRTAVVHGFGGGHCPISPLICRRIKGRVEQRLAASFWLLATCEAQKPRADYWTVKGQKQRIW